jgi:hypothetical protein
MSSPGDKNNDVGSIKPAAPTSPPPREKLSPALQKIVDRANNDDSLYDELWDGT